MTLRTAWLVLLVSLRLIYAAARVRWGVGSAGTSWPAGPLSPHKIFHPLWHRSFKSASQEGESGSVHCHVTENLPHFIRESTSQTEYLQGLGKQGSMSQWMKQWSHSTEAYALHRRGLSDMAKTPVWCGVSAEGLKSKENLPRAPDYAETEHWENWVDELLQIQLKPLESASEGVI